MSEGMYISVSRSIYRLLLSMDGRLLKPVRRSGSVKGRKRALSWRGKVAA